MDRCTSALNQDTINITEMMPSEGDGLQEDELTSTAINPITNYSPSEIYNYQKPDNIPCPLRNPNVAASPSGSLSSIQEVAPCPHISSFTDPLLSASSPSGSLSPRQEVEPCHPVSCFTEPLSSESLTSSISYRLSPRQEKVPCPPVTHFTDPLSSESFNSRLDEESCPLVDSCSSFSVSVECTHKEVEPPPRCPPWCGSGGGLPCYVCSTVGINSLKNMEELEKSGKLFELALTHLMENDSESNNYLGKLEERLKETTTEMEAGEIEVTSTGVKKALKYMPFFNRRVEVVGRDKDSVLLRVLLTEADELRTQESGCPVTSQSPLTCYPYHHPADPIAPHQYNSPGLSDLPWSPLCNIRDFTVHCGSTESDGNQHQQKRDKYNTTKMYIIAAGSFILLVMIFVCGVLLLEHSF